MAELVYPPVIGALKTVFKVMDLKIQISGAQNVPEDGGVVLTCNHVSYLDFVFSGLPVWNERRRLVRFMAKESLFRHPVSGPLLRGMHHIPVDRSAGAGSLREALRALKRGEVVGLFPEGTTSLSFTVKELKTGSARMAQTARVPILPVTVWGGQRICSKNCPYDFRTRGRTILVDVGEPFVVERGDDHREASVELRKRLQRMLDKQQAAHPDTPVRPDLAPASAWWLPRHLGGTAPEPVDIVR